MKTVGISEARTTLPGLVDEAYHYDRPTTVTKHGRPVAVIVGWDSHQLLLAEVVQLRIEVDELRKGIKLADVHRGGSLSPIAGRE